MDAHNLTFMLAKSRLTIPDPGNAGSLYVDRTPVVCHLVSTTTETRTLARPTRTGLEVTLHHQTDGGDITVTVTGGYNEDGSTTMVFSDPGQAAVLKSLETSTAGTFIWRLVALTSNPSMNPGVFKATSTSMVFNEDSTDMDIRVESNANANFINVDSSGVLNGQIAVGAAVPTNPQATVALLPPANASGVTADQSYYHMTILPGGATTIPTGTAPIVASLNVAEPNITATGTVTDAATVRIADAPTEGGTGNWSLWIDAGVTRLDGNMNVADAAWDLVGKANTAAAIEVTDGTTALWALDTRNTVSVVSHTIQGPASQTLPNGATSRYRAVSIPAKTVTLVGTTQVTTLNEGCQLEILAPTYNQSGGAVTVDKVSTLFVGTPVAGASVTISTNHIIMTGTAGCFCTAAGTWTDTSSELSKKDIRSADPAEAYRLMDDVDVVKFRKIEGSDGDYDRFGVIAEKVPDFLASKTRTGVASIYLAGFALAAAKGVKAKLEAENQDLRRRLTALENKLR